MSTVEEFQPLRRFYRSKWAVPKSTSLNFQAYREIQEISRLPKSFTDVDFSTLERQQTNASLKVSFAEELEDPDDFKCCDLQEHKKVTGRRKFLYQLKLTFVKLRATFADKTRKEEIISNFKHRQSIVSHISTNLNIDSDDKKEMNDMYEWEDQFQNNADVGGDDESETEDEEQDEAALQPTTADDFNKGNMDDEAEMDDGGDDPDNEEEEEDQMAEVESEIEALLEIPVLLCVGMEEARGDIGMSATDDEMSDDDFSFDSGDDRPPS
ncbi:Oidioi.mRNA.OKI2018_I69.chr1.g2010.t1.cds [Oikopleura dioica]|uniref:Oidioi.mRNA.OKI2018_I69.chr1.g2010.t1.cds n=1 Tax=Oikopleura dioica TaxID=34765 RepID=A0ABN7STL5_OIKDI|nr:Oidioi.mRNA.OKI2018_I69.chr1.g2010.t1.cds [Oikopleura dioica]